MRIAILGPYFWPQLYGIEKVMYAHAKHLAARGHDVRVITSRLRFPAGIDSALPSFEQHDGFSIERLAVILRAPWVFQYPSRGGFIISGLRRALRRFDPDIVHAHNIGAGAWAYGGAAHARKRRRPFFYSTHHHPNDLRFGAIRKSVLRAVNYLPLRSAERIYHLTSRDLEVFPQDYAYAPRERFAVLHNGVDSPGAVRSEPVDEGRLRVLFVGRVDDARKGFAVLEEAARRLPAGVRDRFVLRVVGAVGDATRDRLASRYGAAVRVLGPVSEADLEREYANADIFAMTSLYEGFGMPYIEAMRYGVPVIGTQAGGIPEIVPPGTGMLTAPGDVAAVTDALHRLLTRPDLRHAIGSAGRDWSAKFAWPAIVGGLLGDYERALRERGVRPA